MNSSNSSQVKILMIGVGLFGKSCYLNHFIKKQYANAKLIACVDLVEQSTLVEQYLNEFEPYNRPKTYFITKSLQTNFNNFLDSIVKKEGINAVIISTPPEVRLPYIKWALRNNLHVLSDKPLTAPPNCSVELEASTKLFNDYNKIVQLYDVGLQTNPDLVFDLMVQRRYHPAYQLILDKLSEVAEHTGCPVTNVQLTHADGQWRFPNEIIEIDYHGYNQGNGKSTHSGYHFFDLASNAVKISAQKAGKSIDTLRVYSTPVYPSDLPSTMNFSDYSKMFGSDFSTNLRYSEQEYEQLTTNFGEVDSVSNLSFLNNNRVVTTASLNLLHNSISSRHWNNPNMVDLYRENGRLRQELHYYVQGPFQTISISSLRDCSKASVSNKLLEETAREPMVIEVFRNVGINKSWKAYERLTINDLIPELEDQDNHISHARDLGIQEFISNILNKTKRTNRSSNIHSHSHSIAVMTSICKSMASKNVYEQAYVI